MLMTWKQIRSFALLAALVAIVGAAPGFAGVVVYEEGNKKVEIGGRFQIQYHMEDPDGGESTDDIFFRRLRPYISGTVSENWFGKIQFDFGKSTGDNEVAVKDAYMRYTGFNNVSVTIGNQKTPFSREYLASSKRQQTVERSFAGDHNYGAPDRMLGVLLKGNNDSKKISYSLGVGSEHVDPDARKLDFDSPAVTQDDWNEGMIVAGRVDFQPLGAVKFDQGDFGSDEFKYSISLAAFTWSNDDDNNSYTDASGMSISATKADIDTAEGYEISAGLRGRGLSVDVEYNLISSDTVDSAFTGGLFAGGTTDLDVMAIEAGYMVAKNRVELVGLWDSLDADTYQDAWTRTSVGVNYFWNKHKAKLQFTYRQGENLNGVTGVDSDDLFAQAQFVF